MSEVESGRDEVRESEAREEAAGGGKSAAEIRWRMPWNGGLEGNNTGVGMSTQPVIDIEGDRRASVLGQVSAGVDVVRVECNVTEVLGGKEAAAAGGNGNRVAKVDGDEDEDTRLTLLVVVVVIVVLLIVIV